MSAQPDNPSFASAADGPALLQILQAVRNLRFGSLEIIVHDGRVVQIERCEKLRVDSNQTRAVR